MIGEVLGGRYRVLDKIGEGAMAEVYLVELVGVGRRDALKVLHWRVCSTPELVARFRREARAINRLQHPNIVCLYDFGRLDDGRFYLTTEHASGVSLDAMLRAGPLEPRRSVHILRQLADAVGHAHERGVIHRDLKPENMVLIEHRGQRDVLKILDFGVSKIVAPDYQDSLVTTGRGELYGTPSYMAPEQFHADSYDSRVDIYAIGCIAFELLVGEPLFSTDSLVELVNAHISRSPRRPSECIGGGAIPPQLDAVVLRCLEKSPNARFQTAAEVIAALDTIPIADAAAPMADLADGSTIPVGPEPGEPLSADHAPDARLAKHVAMADLAAALVDRGCNDLRLVLALGNIHAIESEVDGLEREFEHLEVRSSAAEQWARERETSLRFAIGELRFENDRFRARTGTADADLDYQIAALDGQLAAVAEQLERELEAITERAIDLAAARATKEDELFTQYESLGPALEQVAPRYMSDPVIASLSGRLARSCQLDDLAGAFGRAG